MIHLIDKMLERFPGAVVRGHKEMPGAATQCPGFMASEWWSQVVSERSKPKSPLATLISGLLAAFRKGRT